MASALSGLLTGSPFALGVAVVLDLVLGDPTYRWHPVRLMGRTITGGEAILRRLGANGYGGGVVLTVTVAAFWVASLGALVLAAGIVLAPAIGWILHVFLLYSFLALGDLLRHVWRIERALLEGDLDEGRRAIGLLVGRDTQSMDAGACRRAAVESLSENLTDGFTSPLFWYAIAGLPGIVVFKVASTLDSMVGYKTPRYLQFGWCGARLDDVMNYVPARLTWLLMSAVAVLVPGCSGRSALEVGWRQHMVLPGPNAGWSEAAAAGALQRRIVGPIWVHGSLVTDVWIGRAEDPPVETHDDVQKALVLMTATGLAAAMLAVFALW